MSIETKLTHTITRLHFLENICLKQLKLVLTISLMSNILAYFNLFEIKDFVIVAVKLALTICMSKK
jgi:hypothetical protein